MKKKIADDDFKFNEKGRKFSKWLENNVRKGDIARYEQFLLFPWCFEKTRKNQGLFGKGLNIFYYYIMIKHMVTFIVKFGTNFFFFF